MTFEELQKANGFIKTTNIKGKEYAEVNQRVKAFRSLYPEGKIETHLISYENGVVIMKAEVYGFRTVYEDDDIIGSCSELLATGYAKEIEGSTMINKTSALENCETSAVGRALGFLGLGIDTSIASYEEVSNAKLKQEGLKLATRDEKEGLMATCEARGIDIDMILSYVGFDRNKQPEGMTVEQYGKAMNYLNKEVK